MSTDINVFGGYGTADSKIRLIEQIEEWPEIIRLEVRIDGSKTTEVTVFMERFPTEAVDELVRDLAARSLSLEVWNDKRKAKEKADA